MPPYVVFHDSVLRAMVEQRPATSVALGQLPGVGATKLVAFGNRFLAVIAAHGSDRAARSPQSA